MTDREDLLILAIDTSTDIAGIGLSGRGIQAELRWDAGRTQTTALLPAIHDLLRLNGATIGEVHAIAVASGPGTFTGLRVGLSVAKGLVLANDAAIVGIPTLAIAAEPYRSLGIDALAVLPAGRGRVVWQIVRAGDAFGAPSNTTVPELIDVLTEHPDLLVVGELHAPHRAAIVAAHPRVEAEAVSGRRPSVLAALARERLARGDVDDAATLEPLYVHGTPVTVGSAADRT